MSEKTIWAALRNGGLSKAGTAGVMGNLYCESVLLSNNVENRCPLSDEDYTMNVDTGAIPSNQFIHDSYGYGLAQWTYFSRKQELLKKAKAAGVSIADETMQCGFLLTELRRDFPQLYDYLCNTYSVYEAADKFCEQFERPAVNNYIPRRNAAQGYFERLSGNDEPVVDDEYCEDCQVSYPTSAKSVEITVPVLRFGDKGRAVFIAQCALNDAGFSCGVADGDYGANTAEGVDEFKLVHKLNRNGEIDGDVWQILFQ